MRIDSEALGARIRRKRQELGLTQQEFARSMNLSTSFYGHIERGTRLPSLETMVDIANRLNVGTDALLRDSLKAPCLPQRSPWSDRDFRTLRTFLSEQQDALVHWLDTRGEDDAEEE